MDPVDGAIKCIFHAFGFADLALGCVFVTYTILAFSCVSQQTLSLTGTLMSSLLLLLLRL